eukprot:8852758-Pyramimonas_sp.AAC.1
MAHMSVQVGAHLLLNSAEVRFPRTGVAACSSVPSFLCLSRPPSYQWFPDPRPGAAEERNQSD